MILSVIRRLKHLKSLLYILNFLVFIVGGSLGVMAYVDSLGDVDADEMPLPLTTASPGASRVFVFLIDSLRYQTATDPTLMPELVRLRAKGSYAKLETVRDAVTVPAVRAAFSGFDRFQILGFVKNFVASEQKIPSVFGELRSQGRQSRMYSEETVTAPFRSDLIFAGVDSGGADEIGRQEQQMHAAVQQFLRSNESLSVYHITAGDHASHAHPVGSPGYRQAFGRLDAMVKYLDDALPPAVSLVVFGDHGHDEMGRHSVGLDVPTYFWARGPVYQAAVDLGDLPIRDVRWQLSRGLGLPERTTVTTPVLPSLPDYLIAAAFFGLAVAAWWILGERLRLGAFPDWSTSRWAAVIGLFVVGTILCFFHGRGLSAIQRLIFEPSFIKLERFWFYVLLAMLLALWRFGLAQVALFVAALAFALFFPTVYRIGAPLTMVPVWSVTLLAVLILSLRSSFPPLPLSPSTFKRNSPLLSSAAKRSSPLSFPAVKDGVGNLFRSLLFFAVIFFLIQPYFFADASGFVFANFRAFNASLLTPAGWPYETLTLAFCAFVLFGRPRAGLAGWLLGLLAIGQVVLFERGIVPGPSPWNLGLATATMILAFEVRRRSPASLFKPGLWRPLVLWSLFLFYIYTVRSEAALAFALLRLLAGLRLTMIFWESLPDRHKQEPAMTLFFTVLGILISGWVTLGWGPHRLEWGFLYSYLPAAFLEHHVVWFLPLILIRYALPFGMVRLLVDERSPLPADVLDRPLAGLVGFKAVTLLMIALALSAYGSTDQYVEASAQLAIFFAILLALIVRKPLTVSGR